MADRRGDLFGILTRRVNLSVINRLVDRGNTVIVIEHNLDVIKNADWIIDLGPEGGHKGGRIMFEGDRVSCDQASSIARFNVRSGKRRLNAPPIATSPTLRINPGK